MAYEVSGEWNITGNVLIESKDQFTHLPNSEFTIGGNSVAEALRQWAHGTGNYQINEMYTARLTINNGASANIDLRLAAGIKNPLNQDAVFAKAKLFYLDIVAPDGVKWLRVGPNGIAGNAVLWFGSNVGPLTYEKVFTRTYHEEPFAGWDVPVGDSNLLIQNSSGVQVVADLIVAGIKV